MKEGTSFDVLDDDEFDDDADCTYVIEWNDGSTSELGEDGVKKAAALAKDEERRLTKLSDQKRRLEKKLGREKERETMVGLQTKRKRDNEVLDVDDDDASIGFRSSSVSKNKKKNIMPALSITNEKPLRTSASISVPKKVPRKPKDESKQRLKKSKMNPLTIALEGNSKSTPYAYTSRTQQILKNTSNSPRNPKQGTSSTSSKGTSRSSTLNVTTVKAPSRKREVEPKKTRRSSDTDKNGRARVSEAESAGLAFKSALNNAWRVGKLQMEMSPTSIPKEQTYSDEHPHLAYKRLVLMSEYIIDPLQVAMGTSTIKIDSCLGIDGRAQLGNAGENGAKRKAISRQRHCILAKEAST